MATSPLRNMPPLAAAATECRLMGTGGTKREIDPSKDIDKCYVRLHGDLIVSYRLRAVGGPAVSKHLHEEAPRRFSQVYFELFHPDTFFRSYLACRDAIHQMLMQTPLVREFDLGADNWEDFLPHDLAASILWKFRRDTDEYGGGVAPPHFNVVDMPLTIWVDIIYNEPKALLLACKEAAAVTQCRQFMSTTMPAGECCICMEDLAAAAKDTVIRLPCSHSFHRRCILPWFYKVATCPMCRCDMAKYLVAVTNTPKGKFPGLRPP